MIQKPAWLIYAAETRQRRDKFFGNLKRVNGRYRAFIARTYSAACDRNYPGSLADWEFLVRGSALRW